MHDTLYSVGTVLSGNACISTAQWHLHPTAAGHLVLISTQMLGTDFVLCFSTSGGQPRSQADHAQHQRLA